MQKKPINIISFTPSFFPLSNNNHRSKKINNKFKKSSTAQYSSKTKPNQTKVQTSSDAPIGINSINNNIYLNLFNKFSSNISSLKYNMMSPKEIIGNRINNNQMNKIRKNLNMNEIPSSSSIKTKNKSTYIHSDLINSMNFINNKGHINIRLNLKNPNIDNNNNISDCNINYEYIADKMKEKDLKIIQLQNDLLKSQEIINNLNNNINNSFKFNNNKNNLNKSSREKNIFLLTKSSESVDKILKTTFNEYYSNNLGNKKQNKKNHKNNFLKKSGNNNKKKLNTNNNINNNIKINYNNYNNYNNNNIQKRSDNINTREKNKNIRSNHQIVQIIETNKNNNINNNINNVIIKKSEIKVEQPKRKEESKIKEIKEFKNIQKYFDDFNEEYTKELEIQEQKRKKQIKNNKININNNSNINNNNELKIELNEIKNRNNILHNIKYVSNNNNNINKYSSKQIKINNILTTDNSKNPKNNTREKKLKQNLSSNKIIKSKNENKNHNQNQNKTNNISTIFNNVLNTYKEITTLNSSNYKNIKILGQGSYGKIYLVEDINTKEQYAMKKLILDDKLELRDNQDEYNMIMQICSSYPEINIIHVYGTETKNFDDYNFVFYVLMEVANCDWEKELQNRLKPKAYYTEEELFYILQSLVDTFAYLQQIGVCHRDIKPQNILCFNEKYKISDFGEAKFRKKWRLTEKVEGYTSKQTVRGTELYMSPILYQALKTEPGKGVNHNVFKSDVFSLGMCFLFASCLDYKCLYDMRKVKNMNDVKNLVDKFVDNKYSNDLVNIIISMLNLNEKERPDFLELSNII